MRKERINEIWAVFFLLFGLFTLASLVFFHPQDIPFYTSHPHSPVQNYTGLIGAFLAHGLLLTFGVSSLLIPALFLLWSGCFFLQKVPEKKLFKLVGLGIALFSMATLVTISVDPGERLTRGGAIGYLAGSHLLQYFGFVGSYILAGSCLLLSLLLATDFLIYPLIKKLFKKVQGVLEVIFEKLGQVQEGIVGIFEGLGEKMQKEPKLKNQRNGLGKEKKQQKEAPRPSLLGNIPLKVKQYKPEVPEVVEEKKPAEKKSQKEQREIEKKAEQLMKETMPEKPTTPERESKTRAEQVPANGEEKRHEGVIGSKSVTPQAYEFPPVDCLKRPTPGVLKNDDLQGNSRILEQTLAQFGIEVKVVEVEQGPVITRYELLPAPGVKVNSISALEHDLAMALKATSIRLIVPIPGKSAVGVEVPNSESSIVTVREMIETKEFRSKKHALPLILGKDTSGKPLVADLAAMPHILIAGSTGSGKTVCVNSIIAGLLYHTSPEQLKFVMVDPKMVEMAIFNKIPHMLTPVVTDIRKAAQTLNWVVSEMENRFKLFAMCGVRNITAFNERPLSEETLEQVSEIKSENVVPARLPYIVVVIDELADLMLVAQEKVETAIMRLAQLARAVGIHMILATQRPSVDVITGVIKANFPARVSFKVASKVDSRTVLDTNGADALLGRGDMLFLQPGAPKPIRGQAPLILDEEINRIVDFVSRQARPEYHPELKSLQEGKTIMGVGEKDELFDEAVRVVLETGQASTSNLQRRLRLGYTRAARIIDQIEAEGIIGPQQGAKPREILVDRDTMSQSVEAAE